MGSVYLARDPAIDRLVAIKLLREGFDNAELRERFVREARSAGRLRHVNIVTIFDVGEHENQPFIAMEYVDGETLAALIRRHADLSIGRKLQLFYELLGYKQAFPGGLESGILHKIISGSPEPIESLVPGLDPAIVQVVNRCLEKSRETRFPDMTAVRRQLAPLKKRYPIDDEEE